MMPGRPHGFGLLVPPSVPFAEDEPDGHRDGNDSYTADYTSDDRADITI